MSIIEFLLAAGFFWIALLVMTIIHVWCIFISSLLKDMVTDIEFVHNNVIPLSIVTLVVVFLSAIFVYIVLQC